MVMIVPGRTVTDPHATRHAGNYPPADVAPDPALAAGGEGPDLVAVYVTSAVGPAPGRALACAGCPGRGCRLAVMRAAVYGEQPPRRFLDGGLEPVLAARLMPR